MTISQGPPGTDMANKWFVYPDPDSACFVGPFDTRIDVENARIDLEAKEDAKSSAIDELEEALRMCKQDEWQCAADACNAALQQFKRAGY